jgi:hypothetical protein
MNSLILGLAGVMVVFAILGIYLLIEEIRKMDKNDFENHRLEWLKDWHSTYRLLDIDFESYMLMKGVTPA